MRREGKDRNAGDTRPVHPTRPVSSFNRGGRLRRAVATLVLIEGLAVGGSIGCGEEFKLGNGDTTSAAGSGGVGGSTTTGGNGGVGGIGGFGGTTTGGNGGTAGHAGGNGGSGGGCVSACPNVSAGTESVVTIPIKESESDYALVRGYKVFYLAQIWPDQTTIEVKCAADDGFRWTGDVQRDVEAPLDFPQDCHRMKVTLTGHSAYQATYNFVVEALP